MKENKKKAPVIKYFNVIPERIKKGEVALLKWSIENASTFEIINKHSKGGEGTYKFGTTFAGKYPVQPDDNVTYTLVAQNPYGLTSTETKDLCVTYGEYWDFFIAHASEDKDSIARPLAQKLEDDGFKVWYDEFTLTLGDSLRQSIDKGLACSQYGIIILSHNFFKKEWPQKELEGLFSKEINGTKVILPVRHEISVNDVSKYSPILAGRISVSTTEGLNYVISEIKKAYRAIELR